MKGERGRDTTVKYRGTANKAPSCFASAGKICCVFGASFFVRVCVYVSFLCMCVYVSVCACVLCISVR